MPITAAITAIVNSGILGEGLGLGLGEGDGLGLGDGEGEGLGLGLGDGLGYGDGDGVGLGLGLGDGLGYGEGEGDGRALAHLQLINMHVAILITPFALLSMTHQTLLTQPIGTRLLQSTNQSLIMWAVEQQVG